jgi:hypothetical protein
LRPRVSALIARHKKIGCQNPAYADCQGKRIDAAARQGGSKLFPEIGLGLVNNRMAQMNGGGFSDEEFHQRQIFDVANRLRASGQNSDLAPSVVGQGVAHANQALAQSFGRTGSTMEAMCQLQVIFGTQLEGVNRRVDGVMRQTMRIQHQAGRNATQRPSIMAPGR